MQVGGLHPSTIVVTRDSDLIAYGNTEVLIVDSFKGQKWRFIDMSVTLDENLKEQYPLFYYYKRFSVKIIHWWAAVMGCDISHRETKNGIANADRAVFIAALCSFD